PGLMAMNERAAPHQLFPPSPRGRQKALLARYRAAIDAGRRSSLTRSSVSETPWRIRPRSSYPRSMCGPGSGRVPRQSLDAPENLPNQPRRQVALGKRQDEVPGMPDQASAGLEESLLQACQGPALDGTGQGEPPQQIPEVVRDDPQEQPHLIRPE